MAAMAEYTLVGGDAIRMFQHWLFLLPQACYSQRALSAPQGAMACLSLIVAHTSICTLIRFFDIRIVAPRDLVQRDQVKSPSAAHVTSVQTRLSATIVNSA